jgi:acetyl esterase
MRWKWIVCSLIALPVIGYLAFQLSPWPSVLLIRHAFAKDTLKRNRRLEAHLPNNITELRNQRYGNGDDAVLDIFFPSAGGEAQMRLPTIIWVHGGAFVYGDKSDVASYLKIVSQRGFTTVGVNYSLAPGAHYPVPLKQVNEALGFLMHNADRFRIDTSKLFLAGDSAGSQIVAQLAAIIGDPAYAATVGIKPTIDRAAVKGVVLFCGIYDASKLNFDGPFGSFLKTVIWSYFGTRNFAGVPQLGDFSVARHLTPQFPPAFISAGNNDPLAGQSVLMADALRKQGSVVETVFFPGDYQPPLPHEYQFDLETNAGHEVLEKMTAFVSRFAN